MNIFVYFFMKNKTEQNKTNTNDGECFVIFCLKVLENVAEC